MFYPGARVVAHGLKSRSDLNDSCGIVVSRRQRGRWAVQFGCNGQALSVAGKNLALSTTQAEKASCVIIEPLPLSAPFEQVCAGTRPFLRVKLPMHTEAAEVLALQREMGWRDVQVSNGTVCKPVSATPLKLRRKTFKHRAEMQRTMKLSP